MRATTTATHDDTSAHASQLKSRDIAGGIDRFYDILAYLADMPFGRFQLSGAEDDIFSESRAVALYGFTSRQQCTLYRTSHAR